MNYKVGDVVSVLCKWNVENQYLTANGKEFILQEKNVNFIYVLFRWIAGFFSAVASIFVTSELLKVTFEGRSVIDVTLDNVNQAITNIRRFLAKARKDEVKLNLNQVVVQLEGIKAQVLGSQHESSLLQFAHLTGIRQSITDMNPVEVVKLAVEKLIYSTKPLTDSNLRQIYRFFSTHPGLQNYAPDGFIAFLGNIHEALEGATIEQFNGNCTSGVYFSKDRAGKERLVIKPANEDAYASFNPHRNRKNTKGEVIDLRGKTGEVGLRNTVISGTSSRHETIAFQLDYVSGRAAGVPWTLLVEFPSRDPFVDQGTKTILCSVQQYVSDSCPIAALTLVEKGAIEEISLRSVSRLRLQLGEMDAHASNLLVKRQEGVLKATSIDHGAILGREASLLKIKHLPLYYHQLKAPFSEIEIQQIKAMDLKQHESLLKAHKIAQEAIELYAQRFVFIQKCVDAGLNQYDIAVMMAEDEELGEPLFATMIREWKCSGLSFGAYLDQRTDGTTPIEKYVAFKETVFSAIRDNDESAFHSLAKASQGKPLSTYVMKDYANYYGKSSWVKNAQNDH